MSNYTQSTNFATKDALSSGDPLKIVKGTEINTEFVNISVAIATKADLASPTFSGTPSLPTGTTGVTQTSTDSSTALATTAFVQAVKATLFPVGAIYTAVVSTNPSTLLGFGTWTAFGAGRVMVGFDSSNALFDTAEETGGSADSAVISHTHTASTGSSGTHTHPLNGGSTGVQGQVGAGFGYGASNDNTAVRVTATDAGGDHTHTVSVSTTGSSGTNANYQPYITVYMWKRTA